MVGWLTMLSSPNQALAVPRVSHDWAPGLLGSAFKDPDEPMFGPACRYGGDRCGRCWPNHCADPRTIINGINSFPTIHTIRTVMLKVLIH